MRVADYIAGYLKHLGTRAIFMVSGGGMMHLIDAIPRSNLRYICNQHEQACAMAAEGYARETGALGVCFATSGPGATNILTGLVGAWQDSSPVLFLTGQSNVLQTIRGTGIDGLRQYGTFEVDIIPIVSSVTKYAVFLDNPENVRYELEKAIYLATSGRPGPVLIDIPLNVQGATINPDALRSFSPPQEPIPDLTHAVKDLLQKLSIAHRPLLLIGHGIRCSGVEAVSLVKELIEILEIPIVSSQLGKDVLPYDHTLFTGHPGVKGDRAGNFALQSCDVLLSLGCSLHAQTIGYDQKAFAPGAHKIEVDLDEAVLRRQSESVDLQIRADVVPFLRQMLTELRSVTPWNGRAFTQWREQCQNWKTTYAVMREPHQIDDGPVNLYEVADVLSDVLAGNETIITDSGCSFYVMGQAFRMKGSQRYMVSGALGAMGYALPAGIGVCAAEPQKTVVCVTGDGALQFNIQELQTLRHEHLNLKLFIINNNGYASIRNTQQSFFRGNYVGSSYESGLSIPSCKKIADAYGIPYVHCPNRLQLRSSLQKALQTSGPVLCDITCQAVQQIIPTVTSIRLPDGRMQSHNLNEMFPFLTPTNSREQELRKVDG